MAFGRFLNDFGRDFKGSRPLDAFASPPRRCPGRCAPGAEASALGAGAARLEPSTLRTPPSAGAQRLGAPRPAGAVAGALGASARRPAARQRRGRGALEAGGPRSAREAASLESRLMEI